MGKQRDREKRNFAVILRLCMIDIWRLGTWTAGSARSGRGEEGCTGHDKKHLDNWKMSTFSQADTVWKEHAGLLLDVDDRIRVSQASTIPVHSGQELLKTSQQE